MTSKKKSSKGYQWVLEINKNSKLKYGWCQSEKKITDVKTLITIENHEREKIKEC